ncbi:SUN domain-containing protein 3 [Zancudomyces culisetae]|uniref:SUN domain-containing protein 3 n=1 Tax=Zancudomyces culisetae TaxID=1213189 RepID=A0A1R1PMJ8_ZANCU|nr:SUN domain-containing protein 3 [Zancudomyces culisetae]|eukprot:OMH82188.1 SUN domain-containing protein 3 [Zancudomyces culisetae]
MTLYDELAEYESKRQQQFRQTEQALDLRDSRTVKVRTGAETEAETSGEQSQQGVIGNGIRVRREPESRKRIKNREYTKGVVGYVSKEKNERLNKEGSREVGVDGNVRLEREVENPRVTISSSDDEEMHHDTIVDRYGSTADETTKPTKIDNVNSNDDSKLTAIYTEIQRVEGRVEQLQAQVDVAIGKAAINSEKIDRIERIGVLNSQRKVEKLVEDYLQHRPQPNSPQPNPGLAEFPKIKKPNSAVYSAGARVIESRTSPSYKQPTPNSLFGWIRGRLGLATGHVSANPNILLRGGGRSLGECWAMQGSNGHVTIRLARSVKPSHFSLFHLRESQVFDVSTAPRALSLYGYIQTNATCAAESSNSSNSSNLDSTHPTRLVLLGNAEYIPSDSSPSQVFSISDDVLAKLGDCDSVGLVQLHIKSNWGNPHYTCLYRFSVF